MRFDPGFCPICHRPICTNVGVVCHRECIFSTVDERLIGCHQLSHSLPCECSYDDIIIVMGGQPVSYIHGTGYKSKSMKTKEIIRLISIKYQLDQNPVLPDDLFEI